VPLAARTLRHFVALEGLAREEITSLLDRAESFREVASGEARPLDLLRGRFIANLFLEDSTRTRSSVTLAAKRLGADVLDLMSAGTSRSKGETLLDTCRNLEAMGVDAFVLRTSESGEPQRLAARIATPVVNAGDGRHEHPTQGLLDLMTLREHLGELEGRTIAIVGDVLNSRVARSAMHGLTTLGADVRLIGPPALVPEEFEEIAAGPGRIGVGHDFDGALPSVDAVMMLRVQFERAAGDAIDSLEEYRQRYSLTRARAAMMKPGAPVLHPGPMNRGLEIDSAVADDPQRSLILRQVRNGVAVRMAVLATLLGA
jgi:aspartate carbamoyltransferase catalytic subunit